MKKSTTVLFLSTTALVLALIFSPSAISQEEESIQELILAEGLDDYTGTRDTTIYGENSNTNGAGEFAFFGITNRGDERRALIAFDLSQIPEGAVIQTASFEITISRTRLGSADVSLHRLTKDWGEGEQNAPGAEGRGTAPQPGDATFQENFRGTSSWSAPGGDFESEASAAATALTANTKVRFQSEQLLADIQHWIDNPEENFGWIMISGGQAKRIFASDNPNAEIEDLPTLSITFSASQ